MPGTPERFEAVVYDAVPISTEEPKTLELCGPSLQLARTGEARSLREPADFPGATIRQRKHRTIWARPAGELRVPKSSPFRQRVIFEGISRKQRDASGLVANPIP